VRFSGYGKYLRIVCQILECPEDCPLCLVCLVWLPEDCPDRDFEDAVAFTGLQITVDPSGSRVTSEEPLNLYSTSTVVWVPSRFFSILPSRAIRAPDSVTAPLII
jgi:hypothetical protein